MISMCTHLQDNNNIAECDLQNKYLNCYWYYILLCHHLFTTRVALFFLSYINSSYSTYICSATKLTININILLLTALAQTPEIKLTVHHGNYLSKSV